MNIANEETFESNILLKGYCQSLIFHIVTGKVDVRDETN